ncbi:MAG: DUF6702 family protein [Bacteroidota bacterium]
MLSSSLKVCNFSANKLHDFHTSITEMRYNAKEKAYEVSLRVFSDDLEKALAAIHQNQKIVLSNIDKNDAFVEQYVRKHFVITNPKNQKRNYQYIGKEKEGEAIWIYLEISANEPINGSKLQNDILLDFFEDQTNIVNIFIQNDKKSYLFNMKNKVFTVEF